MVHDGIVRSNTGVVHLAVVRVVVVLIWRSHGTLESLTTIAIQLHATFLVGSIESILFGSIRLGLVWFSWGEYGLGRFGRLVQLGRFA